jgi:hypothetical protein
MRALLTLLLFLLPMAAHAEACVVHSTGKQVEVKLCQQNISIPTQMFRDGFCRPELPGQKIEVSFAEKCPIGAYGACRNAKVTNLTYQQDIHYYGVASDARILKHACEQQYKGVWVAF